MIIQTFKFTSKFGAQGRSNHRGRGLEKPLSPPFYINRLRVKISLLSSAFNMITQYENIC